MNETVTVTYEVNEKEYDITASVAWENDGIGAYEYWGSKCYDRGTNYPVVEEITSAIPSDNEGEELTDGQLVALMDDSSLITLIEENAGEGDNPAEIAADAAYDRYKDEQLGL